MQTAILSAPASRNMVWAGRILGALPVLFMLFDSAIKLIQIDPVVEAFTRLGYPVSLAPVIGILAIACTIVYVIPRTSVLGAILLTGYLGGATATHVRIGDAFFFPIVIGVMLWGGLYLLDDRLRALIPLRT